ncbi:MAG: EVE domain-containing protein [Anaerolineae bacterium]
MDDQRLKEFSERFCQEIQISDALKSHVSEHQRRSERAQRVLIVEGIPTLSESALRELFFDSDAFSFWKDKDWEFNDRLQSVGLDGLRQALLELVARAERGLTTDDLKLVWAMRGLGTLLSTELLAYRFPTRYWTYSKKVTLPAFNKLGEDLWANLPRGQKSDPFVYLALEPRMARVRQALADGGLANPDNLVADIFLWWLKESKDIEAVVPPAVPFAPIVSPPSSGIPHVEPAMIEQALRDFDAQKRAQPEWADWESNRTHQYAILWQGHRYPVKEIVRAATGAANFQSSQTRPYLEKHGFQIISLRAESSNAWLFQANPRVYDLEQGLRRERLNDWQVNRYRNEIHKGDKAILWKAGENRGLYGVGTIVSDVYERGDGDRVVDVQYDGRLAQPLLYEKLCDDPMLSNMLIMRQQQGTNFRIRPEEWEALQPLLGKIIPPDADAMDARKRTAVPPKEVSLLALLQQHLAARNLHFTDWQIATFYTALQTKGFVILSGISGTGKTKLAQNFAELLLQPTTDTLVGSDETISITIQPYMLKYARFIIPQQATRLFVPPPPGESREIKVSYGNRDQTCQLSHAYYSKHDYLSLLLRGGVRQWFAKTFAEGDTLLLEPELDHDQNLTGFRLITSKEEAKPPSRTKTGGNWLFTSVRPDWRDSKSLLGYFNPLTSVYEWTPFLRFLLRAASSFRQEDGIAWFVILDEMNLAHVEYYFADLLSVLESGRDEGGWTREPLRLIYPDDAEGDLPPRELRLPPNLYVIGTVNVDETTHAFSPKVLDRAFTLELTEADFANYPTLSNDDDVEIGEDDRELVNTNFTFDGQFISYGLDAKKMIADYLTAHSEVRSRLQNLNALLRPYGLHFGYRVFDEVILFLCAADSNRLFAGSGNLETALDAAVLMKVLPKFHGSRGKLESPLRAVLAWCVDPDAPAEDAVADSLKQGDSADDVSEVLGQLNYHYPATAERTRRMLRLLYTDGFATFG